MNHKYMNKKILISVLFCLMGICRLSAQNVTVNAEGKPISEVIAQIERNSQYVFVFDEAVHDMLSRRVTIKATNRPVSEVMTELLQGTGLGFKVSQRQVMVFLVLSS